MNLLALKVRWVRSMVLGLMGSASDEAEQRVNENKGFASSEMCEDWPGETLTGHQTECER